MNIILINEGIRKGRNTCLSHWHLIVMAVIGGILLPVLFGVLASRIELMLAKHAPDSGILADYARELTEQRSALSQAKNEAATHLNALAVRLGGLQAQVLRLNALGGRLTTMAGLDPREFDFDIAVGQGGPEKHGAAVVPGVPEALNRFEFEVEAAQERLKAIETLLLDRKLVDAVTPVGWPTEGGFMSSSFGHRADPFTGAMAIHEGVDVAARYGSPIHAMGNGVVIFAGEKTAYGLAVEITHGRGVVSRYAHASSLLTKVGDKVVRGQAIALVGSSGRSTGPHLHFEILKDGRQINPAGYLRPNERHHARNAS